MLSHGDVWETGGRGHDGGGGVEFSRVCCRFVFFFSVCKVTKKYVEHLDTSGTARHGKLGGRGDWGVGGAPEGRSVSLHQRKERSRILLCVVGDFLLP